MTGLPEPSASICAPSSPRKSPYPLIICFGDSITERGSHIFPSDHANGRGVGWTAHLQHYLSAVVDVVTRGFSGFNTSSALKVLPRVFTGLEGNAVAALIWFGANDSVVHKRGSQHVPLQVYGDNLRAVCLEVCRLEAMPILITPPPLQQEVADGGNAGVRVNENTARYAEMCRVVAKELDVHCIDMYAAMTNAAKTQECLKDYLCDGLHLSGKGNEFAGKLIYRELGTIFPHLKYKNMKKWWGDWGAVQKADAL